jgi:large subunit ribosomal protein L29
MAKKKAKKTETKDQSIEELKANARDLDRQIFMMRNELSIQRKLEKPHQLKELRKNKARILTILTQKQKGAA